MTKHIIIIGSGLGGLMAAALLGKTGYAVTVLEKNDQLGGRAGLLQAEGFTFDMGPSWYLMPDIFEQMFNLVGEDVNQHLDLVKLSPSYRLFYKSTSEHLDMTGDREHDKAAFAAIEPGADVQLDKFLDTAAYLYDTAVGKLLHRNYTKPTDMLNRELLANAGKLKILTNLDTYVQQHFKDQRLQQIIEYPAVFLGASPYNTPAFYSLLSHVLFTQGVYYPMGGIYKIVEALVAIGRKHGVAYRTSSAVDKITVDGHTATGVAVGDEHLAADIVVSNADIHHTETKLLDVADRDHTSAYWDKRVSAPSALLMYLGINRQYDSLQHHNLLFSDDWRENFRQIFDVPDGFPSDPSLYVCAPSKTDPSVAPAGHENLFVLVPLPAGITYSDDQLETYADAVLAQMEQYMHLPELRDHLVYKKVFCARDFAARLNAYRGTSLGLAHTLTQTAIFRPHNISKKVAGLYYVGGDVHPGIGMPTTLISAELLYKHLTGDTSGNPLTQL
ncbi:MAG TPA: phytoene desaturase family protein [Candidatus Saccharimonadales bacterium]|nr:phytoene desaturase family protein [Candidatus Saccharimonadales bacterium]